MKNDFRFFFVFSLTIILFLLGGLGVFPFFRDLSLFFLLGVAWFSWGNVAYNGIAKKSAEKSCRAKLFFFV